MQTIEEFTEAAIRSAVKVTRRNWRNWIEESEAYSEAWVWTLEHPAVVEHHWKDREENDSARGFFRLRGHMSRAIERAARTAKAAALGYDPADEAYWSSAAVCASLRAWAAERHLYPGQRPSGASRPLLDPAEGGNLAAGIADVQRAWTGAGLTVEERLAVESHGVWEDTWEETAARVGCEVGQARGHFRRGMRKLINYLGGENPWNSIDEELRKRPGVADKNAQVKELMS